MSSAQHYPDTHTLLTCAVPEGVPSVFCGVNDCPYTPYNREEDAQGKAIIKDNPHFTCKGFVSELHCSVHFAHTHLTVQEYQALQDSSKSCTPMIKMDDQLYDKLKSEGRATQLAFTTNCMAPQVYEVMHLHACKVSVGQHMPCHAMPVTHLTSASYIVHLQALNYRWSCNSKLL